MMFNFPIGTILFSNNKNLQEDKTPGLYNHVILIIDTDHNLVEAQMDAGVILTSWKDYRARDYDWDNLVALYPRSKEMGVKAAEHAKTLVGRRYGKLSSIRKSGRKMNCIKVIGDSYSVASNSEVKPAIPDDLVKFSHIFTNNVHDVT